MATGYTIIPYPEIFPEQILTYFKIYIDDNNKAICPFHEETQPSLQVNKDYVYCYGCQWSGGVWRLAKELLQQSGETVASVTHFLNTTNFPSPSGRTYRTSQYTGSINMSLIDYWHNYLMGREDLIAILEDERLLNPTTLQQFKIGYRPDKDAWVIPFVYHNQAETLQFRSRDTNEAGKKYWGLEGHNRGSVINRSILDTPQEYVVVLLGAIDPLLAVQDGLPAVGLNGSMPFKKTEKERVQQMFSNQKLTFIIPDNNENEYASAQRLASWIDAEVRYFPTDLPHNIDYIDYRKLGKTADDFKREVLGVLPYEDITTTQLFPNLCSLYDVGDKYKFSEFYVNSLAQGLSFSDVAIALANHHVTDVTARRQLYNVQCKEDFITAMGYRYVNKGAW